MTESERERKAKVHVTVDYVTTIAEDPDAYEGETTLEGKLAKEVEYIESDGDYLFQAMSILPTTVTAQVRPLHEEHTETDMLVGQPVQIIWESDFSEFVSRTYGRPYHFQQQGDMMGQNTYWEFEVPIRDNCEWEGQSLPSFAEWRDADATEPPKKHEDGRYNFDHMEWELRWERDYWPMPEAVIDDLYHRGLIASGRYALHVWW